jgi:hypothetical protein
VYANRRPYRALYVTVAFILVLFVIFATSLQLNFG